MDTGSSFDVASAFSVRGQVVLVTGATGFIGSGIVEAFSTNGARVVLSDRDEGRLQKAVAKLREQGREAYAAPGDLSSASAPEQVVRAALDQAGRLDSLINCAGIPSSPSMDADTVENMDQILAVNVRAILLLTRQVAVPMRQQGGGQIVSIASINGHRAVFLCPIYAASKAAVLMLTRELATELASAGIRVNSVSPGLIARPDMEQAWVDRCLTEPYRERFRDRWRQHQQVMLPLEQPLARVGRPYDIAMACLYLCSPAARFVTGADLLVDGGRLQEIPAGEARFEKRRKDEVGAALRQELRDLPEDAWLRKPRWMAALKG